jgi:hypothetical protein
MSFNPRTEIDVMNFGRFVPWGLVHTSFKKPYRHLLNPLRDLHDRLCSTPNGRVHFWKLLVAQVVSLFRNNQPMVPVLKL